MAPWLAHFQLKADKLVRLFPGCPSQTECGSSLPKLRDITCLVHYIAGGEPERLQFWNALWAILVYPKRGNSYCGRSQLSSRQGWPWETLPSLRFRRGWSRVRYQKVLERFRKLRKRRSLNKQNIYYRRILYQSKGRSAGLFQTEGFSSTFKI